MDTQTPNNSMPALSDKLDAYVKYWSIFAPQALLVLQDEVSDSFGVIKLANGYVQRKQRSAATGWVIGKCIDPDKRDELLDEIETDFGVAGGLIDVCADEQKTHCGIWESLA